MGRGAVVVPLFVGCSALGGEKRGRSAVAGGARDSAAPGAQTVANWREPINKLKTEIGQHTSEGLIFENLNFIHV